MISAFLKEHRQMLAQRWMKKVRATLRTERQLDDSEILDSLHFFLDELIEGLERGGGLPATGTAIAASHGAQRQVLERDVAEVAREYGLLFEAVVELAEERGDPPFHPREYAELVGALSAGGAESVRAYAALRDTELRRQSWEHFAFLAHEVRNPVHTARLALSLARTGQAEPERAFATLDRTLSNLSELLDRALVDARMRVIGAGAELHREEIALDDLLAKAVRDASVDADARGIAIRLDAPAATISADSRILRSALGNLLHNAVKFTRSHGAVEVRASAGCIEVEDECGGLEKGDEEKIFESFQQAGDDRSGFGLGLAIAREAINAHGGTLSVRNLPGKGCVFVVQLAAT